MNGNSEDAVERQISMSERSGALPDQFTGCWLRCEKCGALRLLDRGSRASLVSEGAFDYVVGGHRINWREWLSGAPERYEQWKNAALPGHDGIVEDNEEEGKQSEGEGIEAEPKGAASCLRVFCLVLARGSSGRPTVDT